MEISLTIQRQRWTFNTKIFGILLIVFVSCIPINGFSIAHPRNNEQNKSNGRNPMPVRIRDLAVYSKIRYRYGLTKIVAKIQNSNPNASQEINFLARIPKYSFISSFTLDTEGENYRANVAERERASEIYQAGVYYERNAVLVEADRDSKLFNISINIEAKAEVTITLSYEEQITRENSYYSYSIHMDPEQMKIVDNFKLSIDVQEFYNISYVHISNLKDGVVVAGEIKYNGPRASFIWCPSANRTYYDAVITAGLLGEFTMHYDLNRDSRPGQVLLRGGYFLHTFNVNNLPILPKYVIFVLDISASMTGQRLLQLQLAMKNIFDELRVDDYFNIITFSSESKIWSPFSGECLNKKFPFPHYYKTMAIDFIDSLQVHGSTNINGALEDALKLAAEKFGEKLTRCQSLTEYEKYQNIRTNLTTMILFLTDGEPTSGNINRPLILKNIESRNKREVPIFSLAFGVHADFYFVQKLSLQNHGFSRRIYEGVDSNQQLIKFYEEICSPVLSNVTFLYTSPVYNISRVTFSTFSFLTKDSEIQMTGQITPKEQTMILRRTPLNSSVENNKASKISKPFTVSSPKYIDTSIICYCNYCENDDEEFISENTTHFNPSKECTDTEDFFMERRWAYISIMNLIDKLKAEDYLSNSTIKEDIIKMAVKYQFVTPYTSLVFVQPNKNGSSRKTVANVDRETEDQLEKSKNAAAFFRNLNPTTQKPKIRVTLLSAPIEENYTLSPVTHGLTKLAPLSIGFNSGRGISRKSNIAPMYPSSVRPRKPYNLTDIVWLKNHKFIRPKNSSVMYSLYDGIQGSYITSTPSCTIRSTNQPGICKHLKDCVVREIFADFDTFFNSYFCPIDLRGHFIGTCCRI